MKLKTSCYRGKPIEKERQEKSRGHSTPEKGAEDEGEGVAWKVAGKWCASASGAKEQDINLRNANWRDVLGAVTGGNMRQSVQMQDRTNATCATGSLTISRRIVRGQEEGSRGEVIFFF